MQNSSFFDSIAPQIPSLDSDEFSSSDNEEEISVYQRPSVFKLHQSAEVDLKLEEPGFEDLFKSVREPFTNGNSDDMDQIRQPDTGRDFEQITYSLTAEHPTSPDEKLSLEHEQRKEDSDINIAEGAHHLSTAECTSPVFTRPKTETKICGTHSVKNNAEMEEKMHTQPYPVLSLKPLENLDLDQVLHSLKQQIDHHKDSCKQAEPNLFTSFKYKDSGREKTGINVMDQLVMFCKKQASRTVETNVISSTEKSLIKFQRPNVKNLTAKRKTDGGANGFNGIKGALQMKKDNSSSVYIDLRNTGHQLKPEVICSTTSHSDQQKQGLSTGKTRMEAVKRNRVLNGKSLLLQKLRESKQIGAENTEEFDKHQKGNNIGIKENQSSCGNQPPIKQLNKTSVPKAACDEATTPTDKTRSSQREAAVKSQKEVKRNHEQKEQEKILGHQYLKRLSTLRPQRSTNDKQSAAELTDVLYDIDGSHLQLVSTLPPHVQSRECMLLTVTLSCPGVVAGRAHGKAQSVESNLVRSHVYNSLIAWFMSLTEANSCSTEESMNKAGKAVPFWVAGLQQFWREDGLVLYVCAVSPEKIQSPGTNTKGRDMEKGRTLFHHRVSKFLSQTQLKTVVSWLPQLNYLLEKSAHPTLVTLPSSCLDCFISISFAKEAVEKVFRMSPGFYWQTLETQDQICQRAEATTSQQSHTEVVVALGCRPLFFNPLATQYTLQLLLGSGLDVCGLRLIYPEECLISNTVHVTGGREGEYSQQPMFALAIRGPYASSVWQEIAGPSDPPLAQKTDPKSINALHGHSKDQPLLLYPRLASRVHLGLCMWFGGRVPKNSLIVTEQIQSLSEKSDFCTETSSVATLCATMKGDVFLLVSPVVAPCCYSSVLAACAKRGFQLMGLQRVKISRKRASSLGLTSEQMSAFCHAPVVFLDGGRVELSSHCLVLLLRRENALRHCATISTGLMHDLVVQGLVGQLRSRLPSDVQPAPHLCFHAVPYMENFFSFLGGLMWTVPDFSHVILSNHKYPVYSEMEQIVILTLTGHSIMEKGMSLLHKVLRENGAGGVGEERFELLAMKWLPKLSQRQAQELSPFEIGDRLWQSSVASLASSPVLVCALRRPQAFGTLRRLLPQGYPGNLSVLMSPTPQVAFRQASLFFTEEELIPDHSSRTMLKFMPPLSRGFKSQSFYNYMTKGPQPLFTLALFKPGTWRHCLGKILGKIQQNGFSLAGLQMLVLDSNMAEVMMDTLEHQDPSEKESELKYLRSGPVLALCLQRVNAVKRLLELLGPDDPSQNCTGDKHLWRVSSGTDRLHNGIYGSPSYQQALQDVKFMFSDGLCCTDTSAMKHEQFLCLSSDPVASLERQKSHTIEVIAKNKLSQYLSEESGLIRVGCSVHSALCQTTCLLMPSSLLRLNRPPLHLDLLEQLLRTGCHLVAGRLSTLDKAQREHICELLRPPAGGAVNETLLSDGPCLILALQKDNIVTCFDLILESISRDRPNFQKVKKMLLYPNSEKEAVKLLCYLFDGLSPDSYHIIVPRKS